MADLKVDFADADDWESGATTDTDKLNGITTRINENTAKSNTNADKISLQRQGYSRIQQLTILKDSGLSYLGDTPDNSQVDIFTDSNGHLNTINTGSTTAHYDSIDDAYIYQLTSGSEETDAIPNQSASATSITTTCATTTRGYISRLYVYGGAGGTFYTVTIKNSSAETIASKGTGSLDSSGVLVTFALSDYSKVLNNETFTIETTRASGGASFDYKNNETYAGTNFSYSAQDIPTDNSGGAGIIGFKVVTHSAGIVQTTASFGSGNDIHYIFITPAKEDDGTNLITYDVSSNNGGAYTTGLSLNTYNEITSTLGNDLIIKLNIPDDADAKLYGYDVYIVRD